MSTVDDRVAAHTKRAYIVATLERRPPGYGVVEWAQVLMDLSFDKLKARYEARAEREQRRLLAHAITHVDALFAQEGSWLPVVPAEPPEPLAAKARELHRVWFRQEIQAVILARIDHLRNTTRSASVLREAQALARTVLADYTGVTRAVVRMTKSGDFEVEVDLE